MDGKTYNTVLSHGSELILKRGLWFGGWADASEADGPFGAKELDELDCSPQYGAGSFRDDYEKQNGRAWSLTLAPKPGLFRSGGDNKTPIGKEWLSEAQLQNADTLQCVCFGDEEKFSKEQTGLYAAWIEDFRKRHPNVLLHYNHYYMQTTFRQLMYMLKKAKPDIITFDTYYFSETGWLRDHRTGHVIAKRLNRIRRAAMRGIDGSGCAPIPFGQYLLGYKTGRRACDTGTYTITESQINDLISLTLLMGGKWLTIFRLAMGSEVFVFFDKDGKPTKGFEAYKEGIRMTRSFSEHLKYLQTTRVEVVKGRHKFGPFRVGNPPISGIKRFAGNDVLKDVRVKSLSRNNNGLPADVFLGYFAALPAEIPDEMKGRRYFAVCNSMAQGDGLPAEKQRGDSADNRQKLTLSLKSGLTLFCVENDGRISELPKTENHEFILGGGKMKLFFVK